MKRRLLALLLALALMVPMAVAPVSAETAARPNSEMITDAKDVCPCGCGKKLDEISWKPWDVNGLDGPTSGHYYLDGDYIQDGQKEIMAGDRVVLDLRGHTINSKGYTRLLLVYGRFHLMDTVGGGRFMSKVSGGAYGGVVMVSTNEVNDAIFELCSGTMTIDESDNKGSRRGGIIQVSQTATFRMTGGMVLNGTTVTTSGKYNEPGGNIVGLSAESTIEILGGTVVGGTSATYGGSIFSAGTTILKNCKIIGGTAATYGGNIYQSAGSLTIENAVISDGIANTSKNEYGGGNIAVMSGAVVFIKDSTIRNGYSAYYGGNMYFGNCSVTMENTKVEAGVAKNRGNNIYGATTCTGMTIRNCELPGDIGFLGKALTLEGKVKIGLLNHGLRLSYGDTYAAPLDADRLTEGSEIYVVAKHTFTTPGANESYFKGAIRTVITPSDEGLTAAYAENGAVGGYCPHCGEQVAWTLFDATTCLIQNCLKDSATDTDPACTGKHIESGHYYLGASNSKWTQYYVGIYQDLADIKDVVFDLAGYSIASPTARAFYIRGSSSNPQQSSLTILDSYGNGKVSGACSNNQPGGVIYNESSNLTIYGGTYVYTPVEGRNVTGGGVILNGNSFTMHGGTLDGSAFTYTDNSTTEKTYTYYGGCLYQYNGIQYDFTMTAGRMIGGYAQAGGCAYFGGNNKVNITGGQFTDGKANGGGGNIRMYGSDSYTKAEFNMSGAAVRDGRVEVTGAGGGNLGIHYGKVNISDSYIEGGYSTAYGGNIMVGIKVTMTVTDTIVEGGYAAGQSGNVHLSSTNSYTTWNNCTVLNGSGTYGGNMTSGNGYNTFRGGSYLFGTARTSYGGNFAANAGNVSATSNNYTLLETDDEGNAPLLAGGYAKTYGGNLYNGGVTNIQAVRMVNGDAGTSGKDLFMTKASKQGKLTIGPGVTGTIQARFSKDLYTGEVYGQPIDRTVCEQLNANIIIDNYNNALLCAKNGQLYLGAIAVTDGTSYQWFTDTAAAVEACDENHYIRLFVAQDVVLTKDCAVDICGQTINVSGPYTFYGMDSSGDSYTVPTGKAVLSEETELAADVTMGGKRYVASANDTDATFHRLENRITNVALRPSADGIYYTGAFGCDETLVSDIASYGVAVSTVNAPGADFMTDEDTLYTNFEGTTLQGGAKVTGVLVEGIMKQEDRNADLNSAYGQMPIFAASYLTLKDGSVIMGEPVAYSLRDIMTTVDNLIVNDPLHYRKLTNPMRAFHDKWKDMGMENWDFKKIITPKEDDVIDILMVGNSFCYYYVEELAGIAAAAGVKMRVCNLYYSGCKMSQHYNWFMAGDSPYQFFETTAEGGRKQTNNVSLEWGLAQGEWDYISIQSLNIDYSDPVKLMEANKLYLDTFYGYFREQFPKATMLWHQTWSYAVGTAGNGTVTTPEKQVANHQRNHDVARLICEEYDLINVPSGDAWAIIRAEGYDKLCARIGKGTNHEGDYYHDGDVGGGQYLNAAVWFETITGQSVLGNTYRPVYKYNGTVIPLNSEMTYERLQEAAHQAVLEKDAQ